MKTITLNTNSFKYDINISSGLLSDTDKFLPKTRTFLITNDNLINFYPDFINRFENRVIIKDGEEHKNFETFQYITEELLRQKIRRNDTIVVFGGGVTGDLGGFAASSVLRGVDFIQIPTTLLSQVDSSVGGKTGFNTAYGKNLVGAFYQPKAVLVDTDLLKTLPKKEIYSGLGEVIKYAFIEKSSSKNKEYYLYDYLLNSDEINYQDIVYKSLGLKSDVVLSDEKEKGLRAVLNFGHTFAHAIETITNYKKFTHGEAVAMGIVSAFKLSLNLGIIDENYYKSAIMLIDKYKLKNSANMEFNKEDYIKIMHIDKKTNSNKIRLVLPVKQGEVQIFDVEDEEAIKDVI